MPGSSDKTLVLTTTPYPSIETPQISADRLAETRWGANLDALASAQPRLAEALREQAVHVSEWLFARDGSLTAFTGPGRWWTGCSLPHRAASAMLKTLEASGVVVCLLDPPHAAHVRVTLDKLRRNQAVVAVCPDLPQLALLLHCEDFAADLAGHRLWFAWGTQWPTELARVLEENPGLPTPSTFVRLPIHDDATIDRLVTDAQNVFAAEGTRRTAAVRTVRNRSVPGSSEPLQLAVIAPSHFRLWKDAPAALATVLPMDARVLDTDDPASSSPLVLATITGGCHALVAADVARADAPNVLPDALSWITWVTTARIPPFASAADHDALLLANPDWRELARAAGWPADRVAIAAWPTTPAPALPASPVASLIVDTKPLTPPKRLEDYSSHRLLWEQIAAELAANPFAAIDDPDAYLDARRRRAGIDDDVSFDRRPFLGDLIAPAIAQGLAMALLAAKVPLRIYGAGWQELDAFGAAAAGAVTTRDAFRAAVAGSTLLIDPRPAGGAHAMHAVGRAVVRANRAGAGKFVDAVRRALASPATPAAASSPLTFDRVADLLH